MLVIYNHHIIILTGRIEIRPNIIRGPWSTPSTAKPYGVLPSLKKSFFTIHITVFSIIRPFDPKRVRLGAKVTEVSLAVAWNPKSGNIIQYMD